MSKISDELREHGNGYFEQRNGDCEWLYDIADRIDAEMVELPIGVDGKNWTGREECFWVESRDGVWARHSLLSLDLTNGSKWYVRDTEGLCYEAGFVWHECPDSFESIADDMDKFVDDTPGIDTFYASTASRLRDFADRIRKLAKEQTNE